jgi:hypothetical protein
MNSVDCTGPGHLEVFDVDLRRLNDLARNFRDGLSAIDLHRLVLIPQRTQRREELVAEGLDVSFVEALLLSLVDLVIDHAAQLDDLAARTCDGCASLRSHSLELGQRK